MSIIRKFVLGGAAVCALAALTGMPDTANAKKKVAAIEGLAAMHDVRSERGKLCMTDHWHYGGAKGKRSKKEAMAYAIASWQDFTNLEYGGRWSSYRYAASKKVDCKAESAGWSCGIEARPCARR